VSVALRGNLKDFGIADVFQLIGQQRKTGVLEFSGSSGQVQLRFDRGAVVSAAPVGERAEEALGEMLVRCGKLARDQVDRLVPECEASALTVPRLAVERAWIESEELERIEDLLTRETFFEVLRWKSGAFDFIAQPVEHTRRFESLLGAEQILMDGLRMVDEWHSFSEFVPGDNIVFRRVAGIEEYRKRTNLDAGVQPAVERVFQLVDGRISVRRIIDLSLLGSFDAVRLLADLRRHQVIEPLDAEALHRLRSRASASLRVDPAQALGWLAGLVPLMVLAAIVALGLRTEAPVEVRPGFALQRAPIADARAAWAALRVRRALEAHRFIDGGWPDSLAALEERGLLEEGSLAAREGRPYYYVERDDGALLLAPER
jgi:hypothetical protein